MEEGTHTHTQRHGIRQEGVKVKTITREQGACVYVRLPGSVRLSVH